MVAINLPSADEAATTAYGLLDEDDYIARIESFTEVTRDSMYAKRDENGRALPTLDVILKPLGFADAPDTDLVDKDGEPVNPEKHLIFFFDPHRLGTRPQVSRSRKFLAAALGIAPEARVELPGGMTELIGKEIVVTVSIKDGKNNITDTRALRKRARVRTSAPSVAVPEEVEETEQF